jgi:hypothetical protein
MKGLCCCSSAALVHRELLAYYLSRGWGFGGELYRSIVYILSLLSLSLSLCRLCTRITPFSVCVSELRLDNTFFLIMSSDSTHLDALHVNRVHYGALEKFHGGKMSLEKTLKLQVWWLSTNTI